MCNFSNQSSLKYLCIGITLIFRWRNSDIERELHSIGFLYSQNRKIALNYQSMISIEFISTFTTRVGNSFRQRKFLERSVMNLPSLSHNNRIVTYFSNNSIALNESVLTCIYRHANQMQITTRFHSFFSNNYMRVSTCFHSSER